MGERATRCLAALLLGLVIACSPTPPPSGATISAAPASRAVSVPSSSPSAKASPTPPSPPSPAAGTTWTWVPIDGADRAFAGATVDVVEPGPSGALALGHDLASGLPVGWTSPDGVSWTDLGLRPTVFGGGAPQGIDHGPAGWLALGWQVTLQDPFRRRLWQSVDGRSWAPIEATIDGVAGGGDGLSASAQLEGFDGGYLMWTNGSGDAQALQAWRSLDGVAWNAVTGLAAIGLDRVVTMSDVLVALGQPRGTEGSEFWPWGLWRSDDGLSWQSVPIPPGSDLGSPYGIEIAGGRSGLVVNLPDSGFGGESFESAPWVTSDLAHWVRAAVIRTRANDEAPEITPLGDGWMALVGGGGAPPLLYASTAGTEWTLVGGASAGDPWNDRIVPVDPGRAIAFGRVDDRFLPTALLTTTQPTTTRVEVDGDHPAAPSVDPNQVPLEPAPGMACPQRPRTMAAFVKIPRWVAAACYGNDRMRLEGWAWIAANDCSEACPDVASVFRTRWGISIGPRRGAEQYYAWYDPVRVTIPARARRTGFGHFHVVVDGAFDSPAVAACATGGNPPAGAVLDCRERFVITRLRVIP